jgi:hypothetical protein
MPSFNIGDTYRPGFSLAMELLSSLPLYPRYVPMRAVVADMSVGGQRNIAPIIHGLRAIGFKIRVTNEAGGRGVSIAPESWNAAQVAANNYFETVYGEGAASPPPPRRRTDPAEAHRITVGSGLL